MLTGVDVLSHPRQYLRCHILVTITQPPYRDAQRTSDAADHRDPQTGVEVGALLCLNEPSTAQACALRQAFLAQPQFLTPLCDSLTNGLHVHNGA